MALLMCVGLKLGKIIFLEVEGNLGVQIVRWLMLHGR